MLEGIKPPPTLDCCRVLAYAIVDDSVRYTGQGMLFVGDQEVGPVPRLAICQDGESGRVFLFYCGHDWTTLASSGAISPEAAKNTAERMYAGVSALWIDALVTEEEAAKHLDEIWSGWRCNFCGRRPIDFENPRFITKNGAWICDSCVRACYEVLQSDEQREAPSDRYVAGSFDQIESYVSRLIAPSQKKGAVGIFTPAGGRGFSLEADDGKISAYFIVAWRREPEREAAIRAFFASLGIPPKADHLQGNGATRLLGFPLTGNASELTALAGRILHELYGVSSTEPLDIRYSER